MESRIRKYLIVIIVLFMPVYQFGINNPILNPKTVRAKTIEKVNKDLQMVTM